jgi:zinc transport system ATP-binding protein
VGVAPAVVIKDLSFAYEVSPVLDGVTLSVDDGDFVSVIGPNGGGKTTLIKLMLGLLRPQKGEIQILGETPEKARRWVGYVPQYFQFDTSFPVKVMDVVLMGRLDRHASFGHYGNRDKQAARAALADVGLGATGDQPFASLSGGQRQRALIARALASEPRLFFLDEPTANVDPAVQDDLYDLLSNLNQRLTIVMVSHDIAVVSTLVKRVVCVNRTVQVHPTSELTGHTIFDLYGSDVSMVRHDHRCAESGHQPPGGKDEA